MGEEESNNEKNELTRTFICIIMPDTVVKEVARVQELLSNWRFTGKMTELENLHLTLKFLGEIGNEKLPRVKEALRKVEFREFEAKLSEIGTFSSYGKPRIVWIKIGGEETFELQRKVDEVIAQEGFRKEERFMSHLTIARVKYVEDKKGFLNYVTNIGIRDIRFKVDKFYLMKSELKPQGPVYSVIEEYAGKK
jgi:2'-5' RNA ligase